LATRSLFNPLISKPSLCAFCRAPAKGFVYGKDDTWFGACSVDHLDKIKKGERLKNMAQMSNEGLDYAIKQTKDTYLEIAKNTGSYVMHEWDREKRELLFGKAVREYLNWANHQAETGQLERTLRDGTD